MSSLNLNVLALLFPSRLFTLSQQDDALIIAYTGPYSSEPLFHFEITAATSEELSQSQSLMRLVEDLTSTIKTAFRNLQQDPSSAADRIVDLVDYDWQQFAGPDHRVIAALQTMDAESWFGEREDL